ncbi:MAG: 23S rRNA (uracil(1939)-C(5))-methyltransferase RlmD [Candidatus Delongbacteria bacterium]|jgi:23S rRNA (uracil1939-C5)-methyltransferase|nr:23S rRNA (uracil(1939)-C(5))-methyltransferase RlmD [Candidatus Delongbacteria bacterium]
MTDKKNKNIEVQAGKPIYGGKTLSQYNGKTVMLERALPGEKVMAFIKKKKKGYIEAIASEILEKSPHRTESECKYYPTCGGCKLRDVEYDYQRWIKEEVVKDCITRIGKVKDYEFLPIVKADNSSHYRNKMEFTFSEERYYMSKDEGFDNDKFSLGFHAPKFYSKVIDVEYCYHQPELLNYVYKSLRQILKSSGLKPYNLLKHTGFLRYLVMRITTENKVMINLVTKSKELDIIGSVADQLMENHPEIVSFMNTINSRLSSTAYGEETLLIKGQEVLLDYIGEYKFEISSNSFFQVNPGQTEKLYDKIVEFAELKGEENVLDLYCGVGTIAIYINKQVKSVTGFELVEAAVVNAQRNAELNDITNCKFVSGDLMQLAKDGEIFKEKFDIIITDPPRDGMHPKVVHSIINSEVKKIVYVSCNPSTFARDVQLFEMGGYKLEKVQPVDMFPHTYHVETVGVLIKKQLL